MSLSSRLLGANPSVQVSSLLTGAITTPSAKGAFTELGEFDSIQTVNVTSNQANVEFTSIPATYTHLQIRGICQSTTTTEQYSPFKFEFNLDTSNYFSHSLFSNGSSVFGASYSGLPYIAQIQDRYGSANTFSGLVIDVLDYANTNKKTTVRGLAGGDVNGAGGTMGIYSVLWNVTTAVTSIKMSIVGGGSPLIAQYSSFALYGIKVA